MRRVLSISVLLLILDQSSKFAAERYLPGKRIELLPGWGLVYAQNRGIWLNNHLPLQYIPWLQLGFVLCMLLVAGFVMIYHRYYRRSLLIDLLFAGMAAVGIGNLFLDRWHPGYVRDFILTPMAVANLADVFGDLAVVSLVTEFVIFPKARHLLRLGGPSRWHREIQFFGRFFRHQFVLHRIRHGTRKSNRL